MASSHVSDFRQCTADIKKSEHEQLISECIRSLKLWLDENPHLPRIPDEVLQVFLNCRRYDLELTKKTIEIYLEMTSAVPELFSNYDPYKPEILEAMSILNIVVLPRRDVEGRVVLMYKLCDVDSSKICFENVLKYSLMSTYVAAIQNKNASGYAFIFDSHSMKFGHVTKMNIGLIRKYIAFAQEASPIDVQKIHIINTSYISYMVLNIVKPFLKKEVAEKLAFCTTNFEKLFEEIPKDILPEDYGGQETSVEELNKVNQKNVMDNRDKLLEREKMKIDESKRPATSK